MDRREQHPMEALLIFTAERLSEQYEAGDTKEEFSRMIASAKESQRSPLDHHEDPIPRTAAHEKPEDQPAPGSSQPKPENVSPENPGAPAA
jgi:hypothetical protein